MFYKTQESMCRRLVAALVFGITFFAVSTQSNAGAEDAPTMKVRFGDLNLSNSAGAEQLYVRIRIAALDLCRPRDTEALGNKVIWDHCRDDAIARAVARVNSPTLNAVYAQKSGKAVTTLFASSSR